MTKAQLIVDLQNLIGPGIEVDNSGLLTWLNDSYLQIVDAISEANPDYFTKSATADTEDGRQEYELPDDFERAIMVNLQIDGTWRRVRPLGSVNDVETLADTTSLNNYTIDDPRYYIVGGNIGFVPIPTETANENIKLWYVYTPTELTADSDEPAFPKKYHHLIKFGAYANYLDQDDEHVAAENMRRRFDKRVEQMVDSMTQNQLDEPKSVLVTTGTDLYYTDDDY